MWYLWKARNNYILQYSPVNPFHVKAKTVSAIVEWNLSQIYAGPGSTATAKMGETKFRWGL